MNQESKRTLAQEMGDVLATVQRMVHQGETMRAELAGMDVKLRLLETALAERQAAPASGVAAAVDAPGSADGGDWGALLQRELAAAVAQALVAAGPRAAAGTAAEVQVAAQRLLLEFVGPVQRARQALTPPMTLVGAAAQPALGPARDRFYNVMRNTGRFEQELRAVLPGAAGAALFAPELRWQAPDLAACVRLTPDGRPRVELAPLVEALAALAAELNEQIDREAVGGATAALAAPAAITARWEAGRRRLLEEYLDLLHSFRIGLGRLGAEAPAVATAVREIAGRLEPLLRSQGVHEIQVEPGDPVDPLLHRVVRREVDSRYPRPSTIISLQTPGYRNDRGELMRPAEVVATM